MATAAKKWNLKTQAGKTATLEAERFERDGSGTRFYDASGELVAAFAELIEVTPANVEFK